MELSEIEQALAEAGLNLRGAFHPSAGDVVPNLPSGAPTGTVVLAGNAGQRMWRRFARSRSGVTLDAWSERVLNDLAERLQASAVFPFKRPYLPFQRWAMRAEACFPSPLGLLIHPDFGLWHGFRGALLFAGRLALPLPDTRANPCATCAARPCLSACPAGAFSAAGYDVPACARQLSSKPEPECMRAGCLARHACPVGREHAYLPEQARFHMQAFRCNHPPERPGGSATALPT